MKKTILTTAAFLVVILLVMFLTGRFSSPVPDSPSPATPVPVSKTPAVEVRQQEEEKALTFWSGEIIVGDPDSEWWGYIELLGHTGRKSKLLIVDKDGFCRLDSIPGMKPREMYLRFTAWDKVPTVSLAEFRKGEEQPIFPVYQLNQRAKDRPLGALITYKAIGDPITEVRHRQLGQFFEGRTWSLASR